jgi:cytochrome c oxidase subunit 1
MLYALRVHRPLHHRRLDRPLSRDARRGYPRTHGTYFVIAHFHYIMVGGMVMAYLGGLHLLVAEDFRANVSTRSCRQFSAVIIFVGFNLTFFPQFILGYHGHAPPLPLLPSGVADIPRPFHCRASVLAVGYLLPLCYLTWSFFFGRHAPQNPWHASGLEWNETASPPIRTNFEKVPIVTREAYDYPYPIKEDE